MRSLTQEPISGSCAARASPSCNRAATTGLRSIRVTLQPREASTKASRPSPAVASTTVGMAPDFSPTALAMDWPLPPPNLRLWATAPSTKST
ncbi:hypothetical protein D3C72_1506100 [compost metagenome]